MDALEQVDGWPVGTAAVAVVAADGTVLGRRGPTAAVLPLASVTKPLAAAAVWVAVEEGALDLDAPAGPSGATVRHLLAHTAGYAFDERRVVAAPGSRRVYSNAGFDVLGETLEAAAGLPFGRYLAQAVLEPLGMARTTLAGSPAYAASSCVDDLVAFVTELQRPRVLHASTVAAATAVAWPGLPGVLPGFGRQADNAWGLGVEVRDGKTPHWTGARNAPTTYGHFGRTGTFLWIDPAAGLACVCLTDRDFGPWAAEAWPVLADAVLAEAG